MFQRDNENSENALILYESIDVVGYDWLHQIHVSSQLVTDLNAFAQLSQLRILRVEKCPVKYIGRLPSQLWGLELVNCPVKSILNVRYTNAKWVSTFDCERLVDKPTFKPRLEYISQNVIIFHNYHKGIYWHNDRHDVTAGFILTRFARYALKRIRAARILQRYAHDALWKPPRGLMFQKGFKDLCIR